MCAYYWCSLLEQKLGPLDELAKLYAAQKSSEDLVLGQKKCVLERKIRKVEVWASWLNRITTAVQKN